MAHALVRAASPLVATPPEWRTFRRDRTLKLGPAKHPDESGCGTYEYVRHKPAPPVRSARQRPAPPRYIFIRRMWPFEVSRSISGPPPEPISPST